MGSGRTRSTIPDLFSTASAREPSPLLRPPAGSPPATDAAPADFLPRHVLPKDLPSAIKWLQDRELDLLFAAVLAEQERRGRKPPTSAESSPRRFAASGYSPLVLACLVLRPLASAATRPSLFLK